MNCTVGYGSLFRSPAERVSWDVLPVHPLLDLISDNDWVIFMRANMRCAHHRAQRRKSRRVLISGPADLII